MEMGHGDRQSHASHLQRATISSAGSSAEFGGGAGQPVHPSAVYPPFESLWRQSTPPQSPGNTSLLGSWPSRPGSQRKQRELRERKFDRLSATYGGVARDPAGGVQPMGASPLQGASLQGCGMQGGGGSFQGGTALFAMHRHGVPPRTAGSDGMEGRLEGQALLWRAVQSSEARRRPLPPGEHRPPHTASGGQRTGRPPHTPPRAAEGSRQGTRGGGGAGEARQSSSRSGTRGGAAPQRRAVAAARRLPVSPDAAADRMGFFAGNDDAGEHSSGHANGSRSARGQGGDALDRRDLSGMVTPLPFHSSLTLDFLALFAQEDEADDLGWGETEID